MKKQVLDIILTLVSLPFAAVALVLVVLVIKHMDYCYLE